ncbi:MAG: ATP-binding cassette domain-containing protein [Pseudomonadota bacterium]
MSGETDRGLALDRLAVTLGERRLVAIDRRIPPGEVLTVMGPSGSGKSTLLAAITGTLAPAFRVSGGVRLDGTDILALSTHRRRIGLMMQEPMLFPHLSVGENVAFGLAPGGGRAARRETVEAALAEAGLEGFDARDPATLSGGQQARVALIRTLLSGPGALLLDEPFSRLDAGLRTQIRGFVFERARAHGLPVLLVTHDAADAEAAGGAVVGPEGDTPGA